MFRDTLDDEVVLSTSRISRICGICVRISSSMTSDITKSFFSDNFCNCTAPPSCLFHGITKAIRCSSFICHMTVCQRRLINFDSLSIYPIVPITLIKLSAQVKLILSETGFHGFSAIRRLLGILRDCPGFAKLGQSRDTPFVTEHLHTAAGNPPFFCGFSD